MRKNLPYIKFQMIGVFFKSPGPFRKTHALRFDKIPPKNIFSQKNVDFYIFESQNCKMNENYPETLLNFGPLK